MAHVAPEIEARLWIIRGFPGLARSPFQITSQPTRQYNCIAWAAGDDQHFWWPTLHWPKAVGRQITRANFIRAFEGVGYRVCDGPEPEADYDKITIYELNGEPTHAAKLLPNGWWSSKLGSAYDISHTLDGLNGDQYGAPAVFMRRKR